MQSESCGKEQVSRPFSLQRTEEEMDTLVRANSMTGCKGRKSYRRPDLFCPPKQATLFSSCMEKEGNRSILPRESNPAGISLTLLHSFCLTLSLSLLLQEMCLLVFHISSSQPQYMKFG